MGKLAASTYRLQHPGSHAQTSSWKRLPVRFAFLVLLGSCVSVTVLFVGYGSRNRSIAFSTDGRSAMIVNDERKLPLSRIGRQSKERQQPTMPPRESSFDTAGYVHIGKTGGSTISKLLRNGCNSFESGPCRLVPHETQVSKLVVSNEICRYHEDTCFIS
jgi:hypothetical protein